MLERINHWIFSLVLIQKFYFSFMVLEKTKKWSLWSTVWKSPGLWNEFFHRCLLTFNQKLTVLSIKLERVIFTIDKWLMFLTQVKVQNQNSSSTKKLKKCTYGKTNDPSINPVRHKTPFRRIFHSNSEFVRSFPVPKNFEKILPKFPENSPFFMKSFLVYLSYRSL